MTTVAANRSIMAADSQVTDSTKASMRKLRTHMGWVIGFCGEAWAATRVVNAIRGSRKNPLERLAKLRSSMQAELDAVYMLLLSPDGRLFWVESGVPMESEDGFASVGSGSMAALAAMHMGAGPREAVHVASLVDPATGGVIHTQSREDADGVQP